MTRYITTQPQFWHGKAEHEAEIISRNDDGTVNLRTKTRNMERVVPNVPLKSTDGTPQIFWYEETSAQVEIETADAAENQVVDVDAQAVALKDQIFAGPV